MCLSTVYVALIEMLLGAVPTVRRSGRGSTAPPGDTRGPGQIRGVCSTPAVLASEVPRKRFHRTRHALERFHLPAIEPGGEMSGAARALVLPTPEIAYLKTGEKVCKTPFGTRRVSQDAECNDWEVY